MENEILNKILDKVTMLDSSFNSFKEEVNNRFDAIDERFASVDARFDANDEKFISIDKRFNNIEAELTIIKKSTLNMEYDHGKKLDMLLELCCPNHEQHISFSMQLAELKKTSDLHSFEIGLLKNAK